MNPNEARLVRNTVLTVVALVLLRLVGAAWTPQTFDDPIRYPGYDWFKHFASLPLPTVAETIAGARLPDLRR